MSRRDGDISKKVLLAMSLLNKTMESIDSILRDNDSKRCSNWKTQLYTVEEDMVDYLKENYIIREDDTKKPDPIVKSDYLDDDNDDDDSDDDDD